MSSLQPGVVADSVVRASLTVDRARLSWVIGVRTGVVVAVLVLGGLTWSTPAHVVSLALGATFVGLADTFDPDRNRLIILTLSLAAFVVGTVVGGLVSDSLVAHLIVAAATAWLCGFVGGVGPRTALAGVMTLVLFTVYAGTPGDLGSGADNALYLALGGACYLVIGLIGWPLHAMRGVRSVVAVAYRGVGIGAQAPDHSISDTGLAALPAAALQNLAGSDARGATRLWAEDLAADCELARRGVIALSTVHTDQADDLRHAAGEVMRRIARALVVPAMRRAVTPSRERLMRAEVAALEGGIPAPLVTAVTAPLGRSARAVGGPWPIGRRAVTGPPSSVLVDPWHRLRPRLTVADLFFRHATRLAAALVVATLVAEVVPGPHGYWIPMTVAWITRPDLAGTVGRVVMRLGGTVAGVVVAAGASWLIAGSHTGYALVIGAGALVATAFLWSNYTVTVVGITTLVITLFELVGEPAKGTMGWRVLDTALAGVIVIAAALILPRSTGGSVHRDLAALARAMADYSDAVLTQRPDAMTDRRLAVLRARVAAENAATAASQEPMAHALDPRISLAVMADLRGVNAELLRLHELGSAAGAPDRLAGQVHDGLEALAVRLDEPGSATAPWRPEVGAAGADALVAHIARAHSRLSGDPLS